jgi:hypothetical protein
MRLRIRDIRVDRFSQLSRSEQRRWLEVPEMPKLSPSVKNGDTCQESMKIEHCALNFNPTNHFPLNILPAFLPTYTYILSLTRAHARACAKKKVQKGRLNVEHCSLLFFWSPLLPFWSPTAKTKADHNCSSRHQQNNP